MGLAMALLAAAVIDLRASGHRVAAVVVAVIAVAALGTLTYLVRRQTSGPGLDA